MLQSRGESIYKFNDSTTVTTFIPLTDTSYILCLSLLDFWIPDRAVEQVVYAYRLDLGKKAH